ncbi:MAG: hypothetical protein KF862_00215 [Chitinophagaceae bacterium]|nr:hypothetical protein [Chitinophagaceae bacterium]
MKVLHRTKGLFALGLLLFTCSVSAQNLTGQWRGSFNSAGNVIAKEGDTEYVLELDIEGGNVTGYSYSYFNYYPKKYYVICRLEGTYDAGSKSVVVNEEERIKGNTPPGWSDCLQTHILTFLKQGSTEKLVGRWRGYKPNGCGVGSTELERKMLTKVTAPKASPPTAKKPATSTTPPKQNLANTPKATTPANKPVTKATTPAKKPAAKPATAAPKKPVTNDTNKQAVTQKPQTITKDTVKKALPELSTPTLPTYERRSKNVLKTIEIPEGETFQVDFYDNGEIDGDTISVFYNNKLLISRQRLTDKPLTLKVQLDTTREENELVMYADNLGSIPPNTALMIVTVNGKRYEVYITSNEKSSGTIRFKKKE